MKEFYQSTLFEDDAAVLAKYKKIVREEYVMVGSRCPKMRASVARKAVSDYKKVSTSKRGIADLMLTFVESGVDCTSTFGDIDEAFYNSMESMFDSVLKYAVQEGLFAEFDERFKAVLRDTRDTGWGFHDGLSESYDAYKP